MGGRHALASEIDEKGIHILMQVEFDEFHAHSTKIESSSVGKIQGWAELIHAKVKDPNREWC